MASTVNERKTIRLKLQNQHIMIYGAKAVAYEVYKAVTELFHCRVECFLVTDKRDNPDRIESIPVRECKFLESFDKSTQILVATPEEYHLKINESLTSLGFYNIYNIDSHIEYLIMSEYYRGKTKFQFLEDFSNPSFKEKSSDDVIKVYMAKSIYDKRLINNYQYPSYIVPIQVGRCLTDKQICEVGDNVGEHISQKNPNYSELTATYYVWKNVHTRYKGICHYRRILMLNAEDIDKIYNSDVDVLLPLPFLCQDDAEIQYGRYISKEDMELVWKVLKEFNDLEYAKAYTLLHGKYLYNYNILIAKEAVFNQYCAWLFPRLQKIEKLSYERNGKRLDRFIGYIGEILTSFYFMYFADHYKIVHAEKRWLV